MSDITEQRFVMGGHSPEADSELHKIPVLNDEEELIEMSEEFSLEEFQVVRREFFAHIRILDNVVPVFLGFKIST